MSEEDREMNTVHETAEPDTGSVKKPIVKAKRTVVRRRVSVKVAKEEKKEDLQDMSLFEATTPNNGDNNSEKTESAVESEERSERAEASEESTQPHTKRKYTRRNPSQHRERRVRAKEEYKAQEEEESASEETPSITSSERETVEPQSTPVLNAEEETREAEVSSPVEAIEDGESSSASVDEKREESFHQSNRPQFNGQRNGRDLKNKKNKNQNNKREEIPPEINLDEFPDAPKLFISVLTELSLDNVRKQAMQMGISEEVVFDCRKQDLIAKMLRLHSASGGALMVEGTLEIIQEGTYGYIRYSVNNYLSGTEDVYVPASMIKGIGLKTGDTVYGQIRAPRETEKSPAMIRVLSVNGEEPRMAKIRAPFDTLTPLFPDQKLNLEIVVPGKPSELSTRVVDLFCPIGKGQRALLTAPPRTGKTVLMQKIANSITANHPEVTLIVLLVDERPEEVTDMRRNVKAEVVASTFDEQATHHVQVAEMVIEKAKRLVEYKKDVVILLDSITRLARAYNQTVPASGKILSGGVDSNALHKPKRFFGAARNIEQGGSLTIISTALIETGSRMDEVIFEEFKGTGNNEVVLDRKMADNRKFPAINIKKSGTRRDDLLLPSDVLSRVYLLRSAFGALDDMDMSVAVIDKMKKTNNNKEFLDSMNAAAIGRAN